MKYISCSMCGSGWIILDGESFCGWCGNPTLDFNVEYMGEEPFLYADEMSDEPIIISIKVTNSGVIPITIEKPQVEREYE